MPGKAASLGSDIVLRTIDMHTAGEPVRIVTAGFPEPEGATILEKRQNAGANNDHLRQLMMAEPRGHADMYGAILVEPCDPGADAAVLFTHASGYSTMCGHATIALGRFLVEEGRVAVSEPETRFTLECPCGPVALSVAVQRGIVGKVSFDSVPARALALDQHIELEGFGRVGFDIGYGGACYAILPAAGMGLDLFTSTLRELHRAAGALVQALRDRRVVEDLMSGDLGFLYGVILTDAADYAAGGTSWNLCVFGDGQIDRSPTGSGVTARLALAHAKGQIGLGETMRFFGPTGQPFTGEIVEDEAGCVVVRVSGEAFYTGRSEFIREADDPLGGGFLLPKRLGEVK